MFRMQLLTVYIFSYNLESINSILYWFAQPAGQSYEIISENRSLFCTKKFNTLYNSNDKIYHTCLYIGTFSLVLRIGHSNILHYIGNIFYKMFQQKLPNESMHVFRLFAWVLKCIEFILCCKNSSKRLTLSKNYLKLLVIYQGTLVNVDNKIPVHDEE